MTIGSADRKALEELDARLRIVLPEDYKDSYESVAPISMGSAGLKFADDGSVAWDKIWGSFCDLAMAGGPPHKGTLLEPASPAAVAADPDCYEDVVSEICRGITMVTDLPASPAPDPGWVRVDCYGDDMAQWLLRAIVMENVAVRANGRSIDLPAAPSFRLEKEIKNVITVIAKTCHYWLGHMPREQKQATGGLFARLDAEAPLLRPDRSIDGARTVAESRLVASMSEHIFRALRCRTSHHAYSGWLGVECPSVHAAVWMMRALVVTNILARREGGALFVPVNRASDPGGERVIAVLRRTHRLAALKGLIEPSDR